LHRILLSQFTKIVLSVHHALQQHGVSKSPIVTFLWLSSRAANIRLVVKLHLEIDIV